MREPNFGSWTGTSFTLVVWSTGFLLGSGGVRSVFFDGPAGAPCLDTVFCRGRSIFFILGGGVVFGVVSIASCSQRAAGEIAGAASCVVTPASTGAVAASSPRLINAKCPLNFRDMDGELPILFAGRRRTIDPKPAAFRHLICHGTVRRSWRGPHRDLDKRAFAALER